MTRFLRRRQTHAALGDEAVAAVDVLHAAFGPLVPRRFGGLVAVAVDGAGTHVWSAGTWGTVPTHAAPPHPTSPHPAPVFQIGSITKVFTAMLLADSVASGAVDLDEPCEKALGVPLRVGGRPVTYRQLATHRAGLPKLPDDMRRKNVDERDPYRTYDESKLARSIETARDRVKPGRDASIRYSNFGFAILGLALSRRLGVPWEAALRDRVLAPAGLVDTAVRPSNPRAVQIDDRGELVGTWELAAFAPAGGLWMSATDLGRWLSLLTEAAQSVSGGDGASNARNANASNEGSSTRRHLCQLARTTLAPQAKSVAAHVGLAWHLFERDGVAWHNGGVLGAASFIGLDQRNARAVGVFAVGNPSGHLDRAAIRALTGR